MIGRLPTQLEVGNTMYDIRTDFRDCLLVIEAYMDPELTDYEKKVILLQCIYKDFQSIPDEYLAEAINKAIWFLDKGEDDTSNNTQPKPLYNFVQDEQMIFSSINKVAGKEVRTEEYIHWWTFLGYFSEIGEGTFATIVSIRNKKNKGKKLDKWEKDFYKENKHLIDLKKTYTREQEAERDEVRRLLGIL